MPPAIVARSLTSLNHLADNPPPNPPLQLQGEEPLILYIARVPGSRDVFLSLMKPRDKVVSAHDVESSLYYCHVNGDSDQELVRSDLDSPQDSDNYSKRTAENGGHPASRGSSEVVSDRLQPPVLARRPVSYHIRQPSTNSIARKPVVSNSSINDSIQKLSRPARKILGPRALSTQPELPPRPYPIFTESSGQWQNTSEPSIGKIETNDAAFDQRDLPPRNATRSSSTSITIIRRDPSTSEQWNVGNLYSAAPASPSRSPKKRQRNVLLNVSSSGYMKFEQRSAPDSGFIRQLDLTTEATANQTYSSEPRDLNQMHSFMSPWRTPCRFQTAASGRVLKCYHSLATSQLSPTAQSPAMLVSELRSNLPPLGDKSTMKKKENRRPTSVSSFDTIRNAISSSIVTSHAPSSGNIPPRLPRRPVSYQDDRPTPALPPRPHDLQVDTNHFRSRSDQAYAHSRHITHPSVDEDDSYEEMDLSLGQEQAGGGFSGNKAKLGKLIIYGGQGLAMLDLLVAANIGVWFNEILT